MSFNADRARMELRDKGAVGFVKSVYRALGLCDDNGTLCHNAEGRRVLENQEIKPEQFSIGALAHGMLGENWASKMRKGVSVCESVQDVLEAGAEIVPSQFADISAFNETVAGLLEAKMLEPWQRPDLLADKLAKTVPTNKAQEKFIGVSDIGDIAVNRAPGEPHPRAPLSERYVTTPVTMNRAQAIDVTREAIKFDLTRQLMEQAESVSTSLLLRKEYLVLDTFLGVNNTYTYNGTNYNTYVGSAGYWVNLIQNPASAPVAWQSGAFDWTMLDYAEQVASRMTSQETGQPVNVTLKDVFVMKPRYRSMEHILAATQIERRTPTTMAEIATGRNPVSGFNLLPASIYAYNRAIAADGLNLSATNAAGLWFIGDFQKFMVYNENWPLTIVRAAPESYTMADKGLVFSLFADERGMPGVVEPRQCIKCQPQSV